MSVEPLRPGDVAGESRTYSGVLRTAREAIDVAPEECWAQVLRGQSWVVGFLVGAEAHPHDRALSWLLEAGGQRLQRRHATMAYATVVGLILQGFNDGLRQAWRQRGLAMEPLIECIECGAHIAPQGGAQWQCPSCGKINEARPLLSGA